MERYHWIIVVPDEYGSSDSDNSEVVGVLTTEGLERESTDGMELYLNTSGG